ncbi:MAG: hypothetical protein IJN13_04850 [Bacilli bacterium]|nr:hypothetical protein [Bacilli bacterium]
MANKKNVTKKTNYKATNGKSNLKKGNITRNTIIMKILIFLGVVILCGIIIYLMNYFFVEKSYIKINMSTDKKLEYVMLNGKEELVTTQKYVSDLSYSMRYDVDNFMVFKYKSQDIYKYLTDEKILIIVEETMLPTTCSSGSLDMEYNNCYVKIDNYTEEHFISTNGRTYRLTVKTPNNTTLDKKLEDKINYMLSSFEIKL